MAKNETEKTEAQEAEEQHLVANDGSDWTTPPSPVNLDEKIAADKAAADAVREGEGPSATNEPR